MFVYSATPILLDVTVFAASSERFSSNLLRQEHSVTQTTTAHTQSDRTGLIWHKVPAHTYTLM